MASSYADKFLRVDLGTGDIEVESVPERVKVDFVGGRGFGVKYLYDSMPPSIDPFDPQNVLILANGVLGGTNAMGFARWAAITKSPLTGTYGKAIGGADFAAWLKFAGFDFIHITGKAAKPVYIYVENDRAEVRDAGHLWGKDTQETQGLLRDAHGSRTRSACIGPAGEKLVRLAVIASERRTASRCGVGAVMGSKNLKAVAINIERRIQLHDPETFKKLVQQQIGELRENKQRQTYGTYGTSGITLRMEKMGLHPIKNFQEGHLEGIENLSDEEYLKLKVGQFGCYGCMTNCGQIRAVKDGPYAGTKTEGPEYESLWAFGGNLGNTEIGSTLAADNICDLLGIDTISVGNAIAFAFELYQRGIISRAEADGLDLNWGNHQAMVTLTERIGLRQGLGDVLAEGVQRAAKQIGKGAEAFAMHSKGLELPAYEPRAAKAHGLSYATSNIGASHQYGYCGQEVFGRAIPRAVDRFADDGKGDITAFNQKSGAVDETSILCGFASCGVVTKPMLAQFLVAATGIPEFGDVDYLEKVGERILAMERAFNIREGFGRKDDSLPNRMLREPLLNAGPAEGQIVRKFDTLLDEYYAALGYTSSGIPSVLKLKELGLEALIKDLY